MVGAIQGVWLHARPSVQIDSSIVISHGNILLVWAGTNNVDVTSVSIWREDSLSGPAVLAGPCVELVVPECATEAFKIRLLDVLSLSLNIEVEQLSSLVVRHEVVAAC